MQRAHAAVSTRRRNHWRGNGWRRGIRAHPADSHHWRKSLEFPYFKCSFSKNARARDRRLLTGELVSGASSTTHLTWPRFEFLGLCVRFSHVMRSHWLERLLWQGPVSRDMRPSTAFARRQKEAKLAAVDGGAVRWISLRRRFGLCDPRQLARTVFETAGHERHHNDTHDY